MTPNANGERSAIRIPVPTEANRRVCSHCGTVQSSVRIRNSPNSPMTNSPIPSLRPQFEVHAAASPVCFRPRFSSDIYYRSKTANRLCSRFDNVDSFLEYLPELLELSAFAL